MQAAILDAAPTAMESGGACVQQPMVRIVERSAQAVQALRHRGPFSTIPHTHRQLRAYAGSRPVSSWLGISRGDPEAPEQFSYHAALESPDEQPVEAGDIERLVIPGGLYAVHRLAGPYTRINAAVHALHAQWLPGSGYEPDDRPTLEHYLNSPRQVAPAALSTDLLIPIVPPASHWPAGRARPTTEDIPMPHPRLVRLFLAAGLCLSFCVCSSLAQAAGFSTIEVPADADGPALRGAVWTPCGTPSGDIRLGQIVIPGVRDCPIASSGPLPLVVVSHGYGGSFLGHRDTAEVLADAGFVVAAINHSSDNYQLRGGPDDSIAALATRTTDIRRLIDYMTRQWPAHARLAPGRIGFFGFSRGGYTGLVLAGARPDFQLLPPLPSDPCAAAPEGPACAAMRQRFQQLLAAPIARDDRIRAAVIADPFNAVFDADSLKGVTIPIQLWASAYGGDGVTPEGVAAVRRKLPAPRNGTWPRTPCTSAFWRPARPRNWKRNWRSARTRPASTVSPSTPISMPRYWFSSDSS